VWTEVEESDEVDDDGHEIGILIHWPGTVSGVFDEIRLRIWYSGVERSSMMIERSSVECGRGVGGMLNERSCLILVFKLYIFHHHPADTCWRHRRMNKSHDVVLERKPVDVK
jgi:hypothetical protein